MDISIRIALLVATLFITAACTPPYLKSDKTRSEVSGDTYGDYKTAPKQTETSPISARKKTEAPENAQVLPSEEKKPETQVISQSKLNTQSTAKPRQPSPVAKAKTPAPAPHPTNPPVKQRPLPPRATKVVETPPPVTKPPQQVQVKRSVNNKLETVKEPEIEAAEAEIPVKPETTEHAPKLAMITPLTPPPEKVTPQSPAVEKRPLDMTDLPLSFGADWSLDRRPDPVDHKTQCLLASRAMNISDGYDRTDVQLLLTAKTLYVKTDSNIDLSYPDTGLRLDDGELQPFEGLAKETTAEIGDAVAALYDRIRGSRMMRVQLGFWPTWPVTKTQEADFPLDGFGDALDALRLCEKM